jgi:Holliday junction resolvasome RuvABC endonuclease subunit
MRVLGLDLGIRKENPSAAALLHFAGDPSPRLLLVCTLAPSAKAWQARVQQLHLRLADLFTTWRPDLVVYEAPHAQRDMQVFRKLAALEGAILAAAAAAGVPVLDVQPSQAKVALAGDSAADKDAMIEAARREFGPRLVSHEADAIGVALAGETLHRRQAMLTKAAV